MNIPAEFNEIRPYTPEELPQIYEELIADPVFRTVVESVMPGVPFEGLAMKMRQCKTFGFSIYPTDRQRNDHRRNRHRRQPAHLPMDS